MHEKYLRSFLAVCFLSEGRSYLAVELYTLSGFMDFYLHLLLKKIMQRFSFNSFLKH